jgi:hypothetical protein
MALVLKDRVKETTTTTGTGTVTLAGAAAGFQSFTAVGDGNQTFYAIVDSTSGAWEVGVGTYTASGTTLSRTTVVSSSNAGSLVNFGAGTKDVFVTYPSSRAVYLDAAGSAVSVLDIGTLGTSTANITTANITAGTVSTTPSSANDLVNKTYVDTIVASGIHFHEPVRVESPINLNATYNNGTAGVGATLTNAGTQAALVVDGVTVNVADRVLVYEQTNQTQNGVYVVTDAGSGSTNWVLTRASDADTYGFAGPDTLSEGSTFFVQQGATGAGETYTCNTVGTITFGTTNITFAQISAAQIYSAGTGLTLSGTQFSITNTGTAGTYGSASSVPVFVTNAQGQVTSVTNTPIAISGSAVSGDITGKSGGTVAALTAGTFLTSGGTFDGATARTFAVDATSANTADKVVARDASGNFSAGTITATLSGSATSATTSTNLAGGAANQIPFQAGSGSTSFAVAPSASGQVLGWNGSAFAWTTTIATATTATNVSGTVAVANGGTGATSLTANNVLLGNGTSALQVVAPGTTGNVLTSNGTTWTSAAAGGANLQEFSSSGTWTKPSGATFVMVEAWGAGGGGGSGRRGAAATARVGGAAGGGGSYTYRLFKSSDLSATETVTIGAGSTGAAAVAVDDTNGNSATVAGDTSFGSVLFAYGGFGGAGGTTGNTLGGAGAGVLSAGSNTGANGGYPGDRSTSNVGQFGGDSGNVNQGFGSGFGGGGGGGLSSTTSYEGGSSYQGGAGGGGGGSITTANALTDAKAGGSIAGRRGGGGAAGATGAAGSAGISRHGGGGGGANDAGNAGAGGDGGFAAGGGGGGASLNGFNSGAGGNGGNGFCRVYTG